MFAAWALNQPGLVLSRRMVDPLVALQQGAARIGAGALDQPLRLEDVSRLLGHS